MLAIDADSHFMEPLDLFERYIDPKFRERAYKVEKDSTTGKRRLVVDNKPLQLLDVEELLSAIVGYGQKETGHDLTNFDRELPYSADWQNMDKRVEFLGNIIFAVEGGLLRSRFVWSMGELLRQCAEFECQGSFCPDARQIIALMRADLPLLNEVRDHAR